MTRRVANARCVLITACTGVLLKFHLEVMILSSSGHCTQLRPRQPPQDRAAPCGSCGSAYPGCLRRWVPGQRSVPRLELFRLFLLSQLPGSGVVFVPDVSLQRSS